MNNSYYRAILIAILTVSVLLIGFESAYAITGKATLSTESNVTINKFISISFSDELADKILFEEVNFLPAVNVNATGNYNVTTNMTEYYVLVANDSNSGIDLCIRADSDLTNSDLDVIGIGNESYAHSIASNATFPSVFNETALTLVYAVAGENIPIGGQNNLRFWLDVPTGQASGVYNNSIFFKGISSGGGC